MNGVYPSGFKSCSKCKIEKSLDRFNRQGRSVTSQCKECRSKHRKETHTLSKKWQLKAQGIKECTKCGVIKDHKNFYKNGLNQDGSQKYNADCKTCTKERTIDQVRDRNFRKFYGITLDDYKTMLVHQNNQCKICDTMNDWNGKILVVDHNHSTNIVRGLLCDTCNRALGLLKDDANVLRSAVLYLEKERK